MNIFQWLTSKAGKMPVTVAQAAGLTAVVGAAGFAALSYLGGPAENNNTFIPPSAYEQGDVVYVAQGPGSYDADGAAGSSFKAAPSRSIQLANQQELQLRRARELEEFSAQPTFEDPAPAPGVEGRAHALSGGDFGLGMGGNKEIGNSFEILKNMPDQLTGLGDAVAQAQAAAQPGANVPGAPGGGAAATGGSAEGGNGSVPTLASASRNWGGGLTRAGGGSGGSGNAFVVQDSGKNKGGSNAQSAQAMAQAGDAIAQARAAMTKVKEGETLTSRANFGPSDGLSGSRDALVRNTRNIGGKGRNELAMIRKQSAAIAANRTNGANAGALPFLAGNQISGGLVVSEDNVVIGQSASSGDLGARSTSRGQMKGIAAHIDGLADDYDIKEAARTDLKNWLWEVFTTALPAILSVAVLVAAAKHAPAPWIKVALYILAGILTAVTLLYIWRGTIRHVNAYNIANGHSDWWSVGAWGLAGLLTGGLGAAWLWGPKLVGKSVKWGWAVVGGLFGIYSPTANILEDLGHLKDQDYYHEPKTDESHETADKEK